MSMSLESANTLPYVNVYAICSRLHRRVCLHQLHQPHQPHQHPHPHPRSHLSCPPTPTFPLLHLWFRPHPLPLKWPSMLINFALFDCGCISLRLDGPGLTQEIAGSVITVSFIRLMGHLTESM